MVISDIIYISLSFKWSALLRKRRRIILALICVVTWFSVHTLGIMALRRCWRLTGVLSRLPVPHESSSPVGRVAVSCFVDTYRGSKSEFNIKRLIVLQRGPCITLMSPPCLFGFQKQSSSSANLALKDGTQMWVMRSWSSSWLTAKL